MHEHRRLATPYLRQFVDLGSRVVGRDGVRERRHGGSHKVHGTGHVDDPISEAPERSPPAVAHTLVDLPLREAAASDLIVAHGATLLRSDLYQEPVGIHRDTVPRLWGHFQRSDPRSILWAHGAIYEVENPGFAALAFAEGPEDVSDIDDAEELLADRDREMPVTGLEQPIRGLRDTHLGRHRVRSVGHPLRDRIIEVRPFGDGMHDVAIGEDSDDTPPIDDRQSANRS